MHPFRFAATMPAPAPPLADWHAQLRHLEDLGLSSVVAADHFTGGYSFEPMVALTAAAAATTRLRLQTGVLGNDYRHPVLVHRMAALLDVVSEGRLVLGLGAGWMTSDYDAAGIALDPPGERVDRLAEALTVIKGLFGPEPFDFTGEHYAVRALDGLPKPVQHPHPPIFVGGGSPRVLRLAGREADIVGINASLRAGELGAHAVRDLSVDRVAEKIGWAREGAVRGGARSRRARVRDEPLVGARHNQRERRRRPARAHGRALRRRSRRSSPHHLRCSWARCRRSSTRSRLGATSSASATSSSTPASPRPTSTRSRR